VASGLCLRQSWLNDWSSRDVSACRVSCADQVSLHAVAVELDFMDVTGATLSP
jgi:hypothetical protein